MSLRKAGVTFSAQCHAGFPQRHGSPCVRAAELGVDMAESRQEGCGLPILTFSVQGTQTATVVMTKEGVEPSYIDDK